MSRSDPDVGFAPGKGRLAGVEFPLMLHAPGKWPDGAIGPGSFCWLPGGADGELQAPSCTSAYLWVHCAMAAEALHALKQAVKGEPSNDLVLGRCKEGKRCLLVAGGGAIGTVGASQARTDGAPTALCATALAGTCVVVSSLSSSLRRLELRGASASKLLGSILFEPGGRSLQDLISPGGSQFPGAQSFGIVSFGKTVCAGGW